jgi:hypothetical protein
MSFNCALGETDRCIVKDISALRAECIILIYIIYTGVGSKSVHQWLHTTYAYYNNTQNSAIMSPIDLPAYKAFFF